MWIGTPVDGWSTGAAALGGGAVGASAGRQLWVTRRAAAAAGARLNDEESLLEHLLPIVERLEALEDAEEPLRELRVHHHGGGALDAGLQSRRWCHQRGHRRRKERLRRCHQGWLRGRLIGGVDGSGLRIAGHP
jgi:hypothetical protein